MIRVNRTRKCAMCAEERARARLPRAPVGPRVHLGDPNGPVRIAVCPTHDAAGPVDAYPPGLRTAAGLDT